MQKSFVLACAILAATVASAAAQGTCGSAPLPPASINGTSASERQINDATGDVKAFLKQSDDYQTCLISDLRTQQAVAAKNKKPLDPSVADDVQSQIDANQNTKAKVASELNGAVMQFCQANPKASGCDKVLAGPQH